MNKVLVFGSSGYIGQEFVRQLHRSDQIVVCAPSHKTYKTQSCVAKLIRSVNPVHVYNASGYTGKPNVDAAEYEKDKCFFGNVLLPTWIAEATSSMKIPFVHVSSGCIYNGYQKAYTEDDASDFSFAQNNCSFYSGTKAQAEELLKWYDNTYILRLRIPFDNEHNPRNYLTKLLTYDTILNLDNSISHKAEFVSKCIDIVNKTDVPTGIYNLTNEGYVNAEFVLNLFKKHHPSLIEKIEKKKFFSSLEEFMTKAVAPRSNCILDTTKANLNKVNLRDAREVVEECVKNYMLIKS
jgi:dTDP-4-dehydrorhamnose reductase